MLEHLGLDCSRIATLFIYEETLKELKQTRADFTLSQVWHSLGPWQLDDLACISLGIAR